MPPDKLDFPLDQLQKRGKSKTTSEAATRGTAVTLLPSPSPSPSPPLVGKES
jgi:hypothetical protein